MSPFRRLSLALLTACALASTVAAPLAQSAPTPSPASADTDGDGLSDYEEIHKYFTDPAKPDTDGDGIPDGDWSERREYTYSVRTIVRVMPPTSLAAMNNDYQDARELSRGSDYVEYEVVHYPLNTLHRLAPDTSPRSAAAQTSIDAALRPGVTTFFDAAFRAELLEAATAAGLHAPAKPDAWTAADVRSWSRWLLGRTRDIPDFTTHYVCYRDGRPTVLPEFADVFRNGQADHALSPDAQFRRELLGAEMFRQRTRGSCTSSAAYLGTTLRAAGLPIRLVLTIPLVDASDPAQLALVERGLSFAPVREAVLSGLRPLGQSYAAHTFNEVWLHGRWRRLNYSALGDNITSTFGLLTLVNTFNDLADIPLAENWGRFVALGRHSKIFTHINPYAALVVDDLWGPHCRLNPADYETARRGPLDGDTPAAKAAAASRRVEVTRLYWFRSPERPSHIAGDAPYRRAGAILPGRGRDGHVFLTAGLEPDQLADAYPLLDKQFTLVPADNTAPAITLAAERGYWNSECYLRIPAEELAKLRRGVRYQLVPRNQSDVKWIVPATLTLGDPPHQPAPIPVTRLYWFHSSARPANIPANSVPQNADGHLLLSAALGHAALNRSYPEADPRFNLVPDDPDAPTLSLEAERGSWDSECYLRIPAAEMAKMRRGLRYRLVAVNEWPAQWQIPPTVTLSLP